MTLSISEKKSQIGHPGFWLEQLMGEGMIYGDREEGAIDCSGRNQEFIPGHIKSEMPVNSYMGMWSGQLHTQVWSSEKPSELRL